MLIGEVVQKTGFSRDTIRYYEKIGLIQVGKKARRVNNYKEYSETIVEQLLLIKKIKSFGLTLREIEEFLVLDEADLLSCNSVSELIQIKLKTIDEKIKALQIVKNKLIEVSKKCQGDCKKTMIEIA